MAQEGLKPKPRPVEVLYLWCKKHREPYSCQEELKAVLWWMIQKEVIALNRDSFKLTKKDNYGLPQFQQGCRWYEHVALDAVINKKQKQLFSICEGRLIRRELILMEFLNLHRRKFLWTIPVGTKEVFTEKAEQALEQVPKTIKQPSELLDWLFETPMDNEFTGMVNLIVHEKVWNENHDAAARYL